MIKLFDGFERKKRIIQAHPILLPASKGFKNMPGYYAYYFKSDLIFVTIVKIEGEGFSVNGYFFY